MECVAGSSGVHQRELFARQAPFNHITVSKKRNWLQQSAAWPFPHAEDVTAPPAAEEDHAEAPPRPRRLPLPAAGLKPGRVSSRRADPAEENDADDEGEIWYNPIPEDDEADCVPAIRVSQTSPVIDGDGAASHPSERQMLTCKTQEENLAVRATGKSIFLTILMVYAFENYITHDAEKFHQSESRGKQILLKELRPLP